jgi:hypothetical protein
MREQRDPEPEERHVNRTLATRTAALLLAVPLALVGCSGEEGDVDADVDLPNVEVSGGDVDGNVDAPDVNVPDVDVDADVEESEDGDSEAGNGG